MPKRRGRRVEEVATICVSSSKSVSKRKKEGGGAHEDSSETDPATPSDPFSVPRRTRHKVRPSDLDQQRRSDVDE